MWNKNRNDIRFFTYQVRRLYGGILKYGEKKKFRIFYLVKLFFKYEYNKDIFSNFQNVFFLDICIEIIFGGEIRKEKLIQEKL